MNFNNKDTTAKIRGVKKYLFSRLPLGPIPYTLYAHSRPRGFTLIELLVSVGLFMTVMLIAMGALVGMSNADRKAQAIQSVVDNLDFALDEMSRNVRTGTTYHCQESGTDPASESQAALATGHDCWQYGSQYMSFEGSQGNPAVSTDQIVYAYSATCKGLGYSCILRSRDGGTTFLPLTAPSVIIDSLRFYVVGSGAWPADTVQPKVTIVLTAHVQLTAGSNTVVHFQTTVTQRVFDQ